jgi:hypothetical protein
LPYSIAGYGVYEEFMTYSNAALRVLRSWQGGSIPHEVHGCSGQKIGVRLDAWVSERSFMNSIRNEGILERVVV